MGNVVVSPSTQVDNSSFVPELNEKLSRLAGEFDKVVYKDGRESLEGDLNANSRRIYNLPAPASGTEPVRVQDLTQLNLPGIIKGDPGIQGPPGAGLFSRTELKALPGYEGKGAILSDGDAGGFFVFHLGDYSAQVTSDPLEGIYIPSAGNLSGSLGVWTRVTSGATNPKWFGLGTASFTAANLLGSSVVVPAGTYVLSAVPTLTKPFEILPGAVLTGAGAGPTGYANNGVHQMIYPATAPDQYASEYIRRNANHTGGTPGYTSAGLRIDSFVSAGVTNYEWALISTLDNSATAGENVAAFFKSTKRPGAGPTFGAVIENIDKNVDPTSGSVSLEVDVEGNGTDALNNRVGVDLVIRKDNPAGAAFEAGWGFRISGNATDKVKTGFGAVPGTLVNIGFDAATMSTAVAAFRMATNQVFQFNAAGTRYMTHTGGALSFLVGGTQVAAIGDSGAYTVGNNQVVGARRLGWSAATGPISRSTFDTSTVTLAELAQRVKALIDDLKESTGHGLLGT